jgi:putative methionine-R-sulfoxide reductase with GAF domain
MADHHNDLQTNLNQLQQRLEKCGAARECAWALTDAAISAFALPDCVSYLLNDDGQTLTQVAAFGPKMKLGQMLEHAITLRLGQGIVGSVAATQTPIRIDDTRRDARYVRDDAVRLSELAIPIQHNGDLFGVLDMEHEQQAFYDTQHEMILTRMAQLAAARMAALGCAHRSVGLSKSN